MRVEKSLLILAAYLLLAACSTTIKTSQEIPLQTRQNIVVNEVSVQIANGIVVAPDIPTRLQQAVLKAAAAHGNGAMPVTLKLTITQFDVASVGSRFFGGAFAGSNKLDIDVIAVARDGSILGRYSVQREANPGGYGVFFDQTQSTINDAANGVIDGLYGAKEN